MLWDRKARVNIYTQEYNIQEYIPRITAHSAKSDHMKYFFLIL